MRKLFWLIGLVVVQGIVSVVILIAISRDGDFSRLKWLNEMAVRSRSLIVSTSPKPATQSHPRPVSKTRPRHGRIAADRVIHATGYGAMPSSAESITQGQLMALDAAQLDAERNLAAMLAGVDLDAARLGTQHKLDKYVVSDATQAHLTGARVVKTRYQADGSVEVDMAIDLSDE